MIALRTRVLLWLAVILAAVGTAIAWATAPAHADVDSTDRQFLEAIDHDGIASHGGASYEIQAAHEVCGARMDGNSEAAVIAYVFAHADGLSHAHAVAFVQDAEAFYCPAYLGSGAAV